MRTEGTPYIATQVKRKALTKQRVGQLWSSTCCPVNHGEKVYETMAGGKRVHEIQVNMGDHLEGTGMAGTEA